MCVCMYTHTHTHTMHAHDLCATSLATPTSLAGSAEADIRQIKNSSSCACMHVYTCIIYSCHKRKMKKLTCMC